MNTRRPIIAGILIFLSLAASAQETIHVLQKGETLYSVARNYGVAYEDLMRENAISDPRRLQVGRKLRIPGTAQAPRPAGLVTHKVARGETLFGIAGTYGITVAELRSVNNLSEKHLLKEGEVLKIPSAAPKVAVPAAVPDPAPTNANLPDPRTTVPKNIDPAVRWPIAAKDVAYMTGKLYGVVISGERTEAVRSLTSGTVVSAGPYRGFGRVAIVQAAGGYVYVYGGCESLSVKEGDRVAPGTELGTLGLDALSEKPQLFFLVYKDNVAVDPAKAPRI